MSDLGMRATVISTIAVVNLAYYTSGIIHPSFSGSPWSLEHMHVCHVVSWHVVPKPEQFSPPESLG